MIVSVALTCLPLDHANFPPELREAATQLAAEGRGLVGMPTDSAVRRALLAASLRPGQVVVALLDGKIAGMASFKFRGCGPVAPRLADFFRTMGVAGVWSWALFNYVALRTGRRDFYIVGIDAFDGFQHRGVGSALIAALCEIARQSGAEAIEADVRMDIEIVRAFYGRLGFKPAQYPLFSIGRLITMTNGPYTRLRRLIT